jgi:hypothetical protein
MQTQTNTQAFTARAIDFYVKSATCASEEAAAYYKAQAEKYERFAAGALEAAPVAAQAPKVEAPATKPAKVRCAHYASIKTFFAVARDAGLDTTGASRDRVRGALGVWLGRRLASRNEVTGAEWSGAAQAIKTGRLFW